MCILVVDVLWRCNILGLEIERHLLRNEEPYLLSLKEACDRICTAEYLTLM